MARDLLESENAELQRRLAEAEETLRAIREGAVDAFVVDDAGESRVYTLEGADRPYRILVEQMQQGAATLNLEGIITYCNRSLAELLQVPLERLVGLPLNDFVARDSLRTYEILIREGQVSASSGEIRAQRSDGSMLPAFFTFSALTTDASAALGVLITDLTAQKHQAELALAYESLKQSEAALREREEELRRANEDLEQFAYSASHDLQEPIRNIAIYGEVVSKRYGHVLDAKGQQCLSFITTGAKRMESLVKDLLAYTQAAGIARDGAGPVNSANALERALSNLTEAVRESQAEILFDSLPTVIVREVQLEQLFQNLVGNAIKYRKDDEPPVIRIHTERHGEFWQFSIHDNGIGIAPEFRDKVFGLFKRLHTTSKYSGTGIGLAICHRIVERNGGRIWVTSAGHGKGSTFFFTLPASPLQ